MTPPINSDAEAYMAMHDAAIAAYEAATPPDYRYSAMALRKAVDAAVELAARRAANTPVNGVAPTFSLTDQNGNVLYSHPTSASPALPSQVVGELQKLRELIEGVDFVGTGSVASGERDRQEAFRLLDALASCLTSPAAEPVAWMTEATDGLPPEKRGTTADPQTAEYWRSTSNVIPLYTHPAPSASGEVTARPLDEWQESDGDVVWWCWRDGEWLGEPAYLGSPLNLGHTVECHTHAQNGASPAARFMVGGWPGYHTHWTPHPERPALLAALPEREG